MEQHLSSRAYWIHYKIQFTRRVLQFDFQPVANQKITTAIDLKSFKENAF